MKRERKFDLPRNDIYGLSIQPIQVSMALPSLHFTPKSASLLMSLRGQANRDLNLWLPVSARVGIKRSKTEENTISPLFISHHGNGTDLTSKLRAPRDQSTFLSRSTKSL